MTTLYVGDFQTKDNVTVTEELISEAMRYIGFTEEHITSIDEHKVEFRIVSHSMYMVMQKKMKQFFDSRDDIKEINAVYRNNEVKHDDPDVFDGIIVFEAEGNVNE